ncbi:MAG: type II toxin-antitoxin system VapC family toxin [Planctomycetes bacterium]|nr:type II toxin-antitoxin system VapC family toxin [Planctomycetota bacterium]
MLSDIPDGTSCLVDANILYYHLVSTPGLSEQSTELLIRGRHGALSLIVPVTALAEAIHKVMVAEAAARFHLPLQGLAHRLSSRRDLISQLEQHKRVLPAARAADAQIISVTGQHINLAAELSIQHGLLTNDAILLAVARSVAVSHLATNDDDFDSIPDLTVWKPR